MAGLARVGNGRVLYGILRQQSHEDMAVKVSGFRVLSDPWHMAAHTVGKRVEIVGLQFVQYLVALEALFGTR